MSLISLELSVVTVNFVVAAHVGIPGRRIKPPSSFLPSGDLYRYEVTYLADDVSRKKRNGAIDQLNLHAQITAAPFGLQYIYIYMYIKRIILDFTRTFPLVFSKGKNFFFPYNKSESQLNSEYDVLSTRYEMLKLLFYLDLIGKCS